MLAGSDLAGQLATKVVELNTEYKARVMESPAGRHGIRQKSSFFAAFFEIYQRASQSLRANNSGVVHARGTLMIGWS